MTGLDEKDLRILRIVQKEIPICPRPYEEIARRLGDVTEKEVMERITSMKERGFIRRLSGFFSLDRLEYCSVLCGMRIPAERIEEMADMLREIPGVTHNYLRDHDFNMWFALIAENREKLDAEIERIRESGIPEKLIRLPKTRKFKIHLALDPKSEDDSAPDVRKDVKAGGAL